MTSKKKDKTTDISIYQGAPDILLNAIAEAEEKLAGQEKSAGYQFWKSKVNIMRFALNYIEELQFIRAESERLKSYNAWLVREREELTKHLLEYTVTEELLEQGRLLKILEQMESRGKVVEEEIKEKIKSLKPQ